MQGGSQGGTWRRDTLARAGQGTFEGGSVPTSTPQCPDCRVDLTLLGLIAASLGRWLTYQCSSCGREFRIVLPDGQLQPLRTL